MRWVALNLALLGVFTLMAIVGLLVWTASPDTGAADGLLIFGTGVCGMTGLALLAVLEHFRGPRPPQSSPPGGDGPALSPRSSPRLPPRDDDGPA
jgi:hypothetical protein